MVEVTEVDITAALKHMGFDSVADLHYWAQDNNELNRFDALTQAFATHREAAVKAERDRIVAWLRKEQDGRTSDNYALYFAKRIEALESQP